MSQPHLHPIHEPCQSSSLFEENSLTPALALFGLPAGAYLTLNQMRQRLVKHHDVLIITNLPVDRICFFSLECRSDGDQNQKPSSTSGLILYFVSNQGEIIGRKYDRITEELSEENLDEAGRDTLKMLSENTSLTQNSSSRTTMDGKSVVLSYDDFRQVSGGHKEDSKSCFHVHSSVLERLRLRNGDKIIPGCGSIEVGELKVDVKSKASQIRDGKLIDYHPIPCVPPSTFTDQKSLLQHSGTKRYLQNISASERTKVLFGDGNERCAMLLNDVLGRVYSNRCADVIGEVELAFLVFLNLHCLDSFEHWRDLVALISFAASNNNQVLKARPKLYEEFMEVVLYQLTSIDHEFFQEIEFSGDNFLLPALASLTNSCFTKQSSIESMTAEIGLNSKLIIAARDIVMFISKRFAIDILTGESDGHIMSNINCKMHGIVKEVNLTNGEIGIDDEEGPVLIPSSEIEDSMQRSELLLSKAMPVIDDDRLKYLQKKYPFLTSSISPKEDIMMTCARILDEKKDASLVREAATFLEEISCNESLIDF